MRAKTSLSCRPLAQWLVVALMALAPLACIAYCHITHEVAHRASNHAAMHDAGEAPLNDMQQLVHAVTDALPLQMAWFALLIVMALRMSLRTDPLHRAQTPPTPPPKRVVLSLAFC
jgi:5'-deoxynucleotidase YfbR-like HD superfamily hydrolase